MCRLFCFSRLTPWSRILPVRKNDLLMFVANPSTSTPPTMPPKISGGVPVEAPDAGPGSCEIEPVRRSFQAFEEIPYNRRGLRQNALILFHAGVDEPLYV